MLSHELRNPLAAVLSAAKVMRMRTNDALVADRAHQVLERQSAHMARLLDDLLDVSRITRGGIELRKEDLDFRDVIDLAREALNPMLEDRRATVILDVPDQAIPVRGDPARLQQVVVNLLSNAARYSPAGKTIRLSARVDGEWVVLSVKDQGRGIAAEMLPEIFELFVQADQGLDRSLGGLGIGLTLVRKIVELHGGTVEARSDGAGSGSEFIVRIPWQSHSLFQSAQSAIPESGPRRIVVVEDQDDSRQMLRVLLETSGHLVIDEADGHAAIETIEREHPDVALIDIGLPLLSGYEVARKLRQNPVLDDVVLVALTGYGTDEDVKAARDAGFDEHLTKPTDPDLIAEIIARRGRRRKAS
jgi:CheY-like chemotaxis protein